MKNKLIVSQWIAVLLLCLNEVFKGAVITYIDVNLPLGAGLVYTFLLYAFYLAFFTVTAVNLCRLISRFSILRLVSIVVAVLSLLILLIPFTTAYAKFNVNSFEDERQKIIDRFNENYENFTQIDEHEYQVSSLSVSYTSTFFVDEGKFMFYLYTGAAGSAVVVYVPEEEVLSDNDFTYGASLEEDNGFIRIEKISDNYYYAVIPRY